MAKCPECGKSAGFLPGLCSVCLERHDVAERARISGIVADTEAAQNAKARALAMLAAQTTTAFELPGMRVTATLGIVRGLSVRSPKIGQGLMASLETIGGGENSALAKMCDDTRQTALIRMWESAHAMGATGVIGCRYDANEIAPGIAEVLCYGTAVRLSEVE